jgi:hypothetical protein
MSFDAPTATDTVALAKVTDKLMDVDLTHFEVSMLCLSNNMLSEATDKALYFHSVPGLNVTPWHTNGYMLYSSDWESDFPEAQQFLVEHPELGPLLKFAEERGYNYVRFTSNDAELPPQLGFPVFEW